MLTFNCLGQRFQRSSLFVTKPKGFDRLEHIVMVCLVDSSRISEPIMKNPIYFINLRRVGALEEYFCDDD